MKEDTIRENVLGIIKEALEDAYTEGLATAWECADKVARTMTHKEICECFGDRDEIGRKMIFEEYSATETIEKIKRYEEGKRDLGACFGCVRFEKDVPCPDCSRNYVDKYKTEVPFGGDVK